MLNKKISREEIQLYWNTIHKHHNKKCRLKQVNSGSYELLNELCELKVNFDTGWILKHISHWNYVYLLNMFLGKNEKKSLFNAKWTWTIVIIVVLFQLCLTCFSGRKHVKLWTFTPRPLQKHMWLIPVVAGDAQGAD